MRIHRWSKLHLYKGTKHICQSLQSPTSYLRNPIRGQRQTNETGLEAATKALLDAGVFGSIRNLPIAAFVGHVFGASTCGQAALYQLGLTGIPITNVNNNCTTGSTALFQAAILDREARSRL
ncbi:hypothetical protein F5888DRAFT_1799079 [Russula emetica]|nr:hypothetical protein F5888DRAFT_1799079 [Russula emetica]